MLMGGAAGLRPVLAQASPPDGPYLAEVRLLGDGLPGLTDEELEEQLRTRSNRRFLGIPGITPGRWIYDLGGDGDGALARAFRRAGEAPALFDPIGVDTDRERLIALFRQEGFRAARVTTTIDTLDVDPLRLRVTFDVAAGPPTALRMVRYEGLDRLTDDERMAWAGAARLNLRPVDAEPLVFQAEGHRFSERELLEERRALLDFLRSRGFARVGRDSIQAVVFGLPGGDVEGTPPDSVDVTFRVQTGRRFVFGDLVLDVNGPEEDAPLRADTVALGDGEVRTQIRGERRLSPRLLRRALRVTPGTLYDVRDLLETKRRLERTGVFAFSEITTLSPSASPDGRPRMPHRIALRTRPRHTFRLEGFVLQRTGLLGAETEELALGAGTAYRNLNVFGGGEAFTLRTTGSVAGDFADGFPTVQAEVGTSLSLPGLLPPLGGVERALAPDDARTRLSLSLLTARRSNLGVLIRGRATLGVRYDIQHTPSLASFLDVIDFGLSDPDTLDGFSARFLSFVDDPVARQFVLEDYTRPQVNNAFRYTLRSITADPFRRDRGRSVEVSLEAGGHVSSLLDRWVFTPDSTEGSLPGLPLFGGDASNRLEYRPYVRGQFDARRYLPRGRATYAGKLIAGAALATGQSPVVPFDRRFYAGGASSIRGFRLRSLGPGRVDAEGAFVQGGDIKLELSAEARYVVIRPLFNADWQAAAFVDAGNVWFGPRNPGDPDGQFEAGRFYRELGVGAGLGLRIAWDYLILRFDLAWPVHSPISGTPLLPDGLGQPLLHFGIGQAF